MRTVTTRRTSPDGKSVVSVTKTVVNPDGTETTTTSSNLDEDATTATSNRDPSDDDDLNYPEGQGFGVLSRGRFDLSKWSDDDSCLEDSAADSQASLEDSDIGNGGIKDSGYGDLSSGMAIGSAEGLEQRELKGILKKSRSADSNPNKGIKFADSVVGG
jgi:hypothetical protein